MLSHFFSKFRGRNFSKVVSDVTRRTFFRTEFHVTRCPISEPCGPIDSNRCASLLYIKAAATRARTLSVSQSHSSLDSTGGGTPRGSPDHSVRDIRPGRQDTYTHSLVGHSNLVTGLYCWCRVGRRTIRSGTFVPDVETLAR